jgi:hypothetical protein
MAPAPVQNMELLVRNRRGILSQRVKTSSMGTATLYVSKKYTWEENFQRIYSRMCCLPSFHTNKMSHFDV